MYPSCSQLWWKMLYRKILRYENMPPAIWNIYLICACNKFLMKGLARNVRTFLVFLDIYPIVPYAPAFSHRFLLLVTVVKNNDSRHIIYISTPWYWNCSCFILILILIHNNIQCCMSCWNLQFNPLYITTHIEIKSCLFYPFIICVCFR